MENVQFDLEGSGSMKSLKCLHCGTDLADLTRLRGELEQERESKGKLIDKIAKATCEKYYLEKQLREAEARELVFKEKFEFTKTEFAEHQARVNKTAYKTGKEISLKNEEIKNLSDSCAKMRYIVEAAKKHCSTCQFGAPLGDDCPLDEFGCDCKELCKAVKCFGGE
jgi:hypothetical protein